MAEERRPEKRFPSYSYAILPDNLPKRPDDPPPLLKVGHCSFSSRDATVQDDYVSVIPSQILGEDYLEWYYYQKQFEEKHKPYLLTLDDKVKPPVALAKGVSMFLMDWMREWGFPLIMRRTEFEDEQIQPLFIYCEDEVKGFVRSILTHLKELYGKGLVHGNIQHGIIIHAQEGAMLFNFRRRNGIMEKLQISELCDLKNLLKEFLIYPHPADRYEEFQDQDQLTPFFQSVMMSLPDRGVVSRFGFLPPMWYLDPPCLWDDEGQINFMMEFHSFLYSQKNLKLLKYLADKIQDCFTLAGIEDDWHLRLSHESTLHLVYTNGGENDKPFVKDSVTIVLFWRIAFQHYNERIEDGNKKYNREEVLQMLKQDNLDVVWDVHNATHRIMVMLKEMRNPLWKDFMRQLKINV